jgi:2-polyprenyl-6-hydroxyphenyl methylase/3-demethylubiquinone-9 3-methyltransferase
LPRGTDRWDKLVTPNEFEAALARQGLRVIAQTGVVYDLLADGWRLAADMDVNYMLAAEKPQAAERPQAAEKPLSDA